jgi:hypothetical protein
MNSARIRKWAAAVAVVGLLASVPAGAKERREAKRWITGEMWSTAWSQAIQVVAGWIGFKEGECGSLIDPSGSCQPTPTSPTTQDSTAGECGSMIDPFGRCHP